MKKLLLGFAALLIAATFVFAFAPKANNVQINKEGKSFAIDYHSFSTSIAQPPSRADLDNVNNWSSAASSNPCPQTGNKLCAIAFDNSLTTLADAVQAIPAGQSFVNGATYTDANGATIIVYVRP